MVQRIKIPPVSHVNIQQYSKRHPFHHHQFHLLSSQQHLYFLPQFDLSANLACRAPDNFSHIPAISFGKRKYLCKLADILTSAPGSNIHQKFFQGYIDIQPPSDKIQLPANQRILPEHHLHILPALQKSVLHRITCLKGCCYRQNALPELRCQFFPVPFSLLSANPQKSHNSYRGKGDNCQITAIEKICQETSDTRTEADSQYPLPSFPADLTIVLPP